MTATTERPAVERPAWHAIHGTEALSRLDSNLLGLSSGDVARRLSERGPNRLPEARGRSAMRMFADQFRSVLVGLLVVAAALMFALGETTDGAAIVAILVLNAVLGFAQERRAADALAALRRMTAATARVRRDGHVEIVDAETLVPGDLVVLEAGDRVPADLRLLRTSSFATLESALTGESDAVEKDGGAILDATAAVADRRNAAWSGTVAVRGEAEGVVVATAGDTEFGRIAALVGDAEEHETPLQARLRTFGRALTWICGAVVLVVFVLGVLRGVPAIEMALTSVSLAVAAIPEGLPAVVTIALALGVTRMAKRRALVRRLPAVETLGCTSVICTDKTGTLTVGEMTVRVIATQDDEAELTGEGYRAEGRFRRGGRDVELDREEPCVRTLHAAVACCTARLVAHEDGTLAVAGDPTEGAILVAGLKAGMAPEALDADEPVLATLPFDAGRRRMAVIRRHPAGARSYVKGAPESVLDRCTSVADAGHVRPLVPDDRTKLAARNDLLAARGLRVLAVASHDVPAGSVFTPEVCESELTFLGLVAMQDPPRAEAKSAVARCRDAGIRVVMITGDQPATAFAIARELGIATDAAQVVGGAELDQLDAAAFGRRVPEVTVFARATPEHKLRIVEAWRRHGAVVAMTGDGVNDAPALRGADIGIAMGRTGTDVAKDASAMVIADDDFATIVAAVEEGRRIYENIRKTVAYLLGGNLAEILVVGTTVAAGLPLPLLPIQLLWVNFVTDGLPALALATDPADPDVLRGPPRKPGGEIADREFLLQTALTAVLVAGVTLAGFLVGLRGEGSIEIARTYAFSILVLAEVLRSFASRSRARLFWEVGATSNVRLLLVVVGTVLLQLWSHHSGALERFLHTGELPWDRCAVVVLLALVPVTVLEGMKLVRRARPRREGAGA